MTIEIGLPEDANDTDVREELRDLISVSAGLQSGDALADAFSEFGQRHGLRMEPVDVVNVELWLIRFVR